MSTEQIKTTANQIMNALHQHNLEGVAAYCAPTCRFYGWAPEAMDTTGYIAAMSALLAAFPDARFPVTEMIAEGNRVAVPHRMQGVHKGEFQGVPATGKSVVVNAVVIMHIEAGKAVEMTLNADFLGLMQQLGAVPMPTGV